MNCTSIVMSNLWRAVHFNITVLSISDFLPEAHTSSV